jgi:hypothetical protein
MELPLFLKLESVADKKGIFTIKEIVGYLILFTQFFNKIHSMKYNLEIKDGITFQQLQQEINEGARFIVFPYCISLVAISLRRFSPAIFFPKNESTNPYSKKYSLISILFGWWGIPWGIVHTINALKTNKAGGVDVTSDIMLNLTAESFGKKEVMLTLTQSLFMKPDKWDKKALTKSLGKLFAQDPNILKIISGIDLNTTAPSFTIGIKCKANAEQYFEPFHKALSKEFRNHVQFGFIELNDADEICKLLEQQGECIFE